MTNKKLYQKCQATASFITCALFLNIVFIHPGFTQLQDSGRSYADRQNPKLSKSGPIYADPNVYVYTAEFAKRFQMPDAWISTDLKGVDAVAWRLMPSYKECGWGGDPKACSDSVQCEVDLYFDHQQQPMPWDPQRPERYISPFKSSVGFLANYPRIDAVNHPNYPVTFRKLREPVRPKDDFFSDDSPFIDPKSGKGLTIQYFSSLAERSGWGFRDFTTYDKEVFPRMALVTMQEPSCDGVIAAYVFANDYVRPPLDTKDNAVVHAVLLPQSWRDRVALAAKDHQERRDAFFKSEGERAIKALREKSAQ
jgi:hypothetical protein